MRMKPFPSHLLLPVWLLLTALLGAQTKPEFKKENRSDVVAFILRELAKTEGAKTSMADSGSGKVTSDMDVTCKFYLVRPDGTKDYDLTPRFIEVAEKHFGKGSFVLDEYGCIQSVVLDTAVHDAKNAVPDFHSAMPVEEFRTKFMEALQRKERNPDAYFTSGGNRKQVDQRMQSKSRLRVFDADGNETQVTVDRSNEAEYNAAMKTYFDMNPEEVMSRKRGPDLFGDSFDAFRQATLHDHGDDLTRGDAKYNTRIINNYLELSGFPGNWEKLPPAAREAALSRIFPGADKAEQRGRIASLLDDSFKIYNARGTGTGPKVDDLAAFKEVSLAFQQAAIAGSAAVRIRDIMDPRISLQDVYDHAQALAQEQGKTWIGMDLEERRKFFEKAKANREGLIDKLKFSAAGELAVAFKFLEGTDSHRTKGLKQQILNSVPPEQRPYVELQMRMAQAYLRDPDNRTKNVKAVMERKDGVLEVIKRDGLLSAADLAEADAAKKQGWAGFRKVLLFTGAAYQSYQKIQEDWDNLKNNLDPTARQWAGALDKLDKAQSILNLIKVYQANPNDPEALRRAVYTELASRYVPGYSYFQMLQQWHSGDPAAREEVAKSLVFQGLTMLPGGAIAQTVKMGFDVAKTGLEITIGSELSSMGDENVKRWLEDGQRQTILYDVPGADAAAKRKNFFSFMTKHGVMANAHRSILRIKKHWDMLPAYKKGEKAEQSRYQGKLDSYFSLVRMRITRMVDSYIEQNAARGTIATGSRAKMIDLLYADYVNGSSREMGANALRSAQEAVAREANILDTIDNYGYALFSKGLKTAEDWALSKGGLPPKANRRGWEIRCTEARETAGELAAGVQVVPPVEATFEEQSTIYHLKIVSTKIEPYPDPGAPPDAVPSRCKITVNFELVNSVTGKKLAEKEFEYIRKPAGPPRLTGHYLEYYGENSTAEKREEFDFYLSTPAEFWAHATKVYGKPPNAEEKAESERANLHFLQGLEEKPLMDGLMQITTGDKAKAKELVGKLISGELWMLFHGSYTRYSPGNKKDYVRHFDSGLADGEHIKYHPNGQVQEKGNLSGNRQNGEWLEFDEAGRLLATTHYEMGVAKWSYRKSYHKNGQLASDGPKKLAGKETAYPSAPDIEDGPFTYYYENGQMSARGRYVQGRRIGVWEQWAESGRLAIKEEFTDPPDPNRTWIMTQYDRNGKIWEQGAYNQFGRKHGEWLEDGEINEYDQGHFKRRLRQAPP